MIASAYPLISPSNGVSREARRRAAPFFPVTPISVRRLVWSIALGLGIVCPLMIGLAWLELPHSETAARLGQQRWVQYSLYPGETFLKAVLIVPLLEEIFYRGIVLQLLRRYCPLWFAVLVSSTFFAVTHLGNSATNAALVLVLGGVFAWLTVHTRSLFASLVCHASVNFSWLFLLAPTFGIMEKALALDPNLPLPTINPLTDTFPIWWTVVSVGLVIAAAIMIVKSPASEWAQA